MIGIDRVAITDVIKQDMQLTDEQWSVVERLIPKPNVRKDGKGRPRVDARNVLDGMLWILWTGAPWKALPSEYPPYQTVHRRMQEWVESRVFWKVVKALAEPAEVSPRLDQVKRADNLDLRAANKSLLHERLPDCDLSLRSGVVARKLC